MSHNCVGRTDAGGGERGSDEVPAAFRMKSHGSRSLFTGKINIVLKDSGCGGFALYYYILGAFYLLFFFWKNRVEKEGGQKTARSHLRRERMKKLIFSIRCAATVKSYGGFEHFMKFFVFFFLKILIECQTDFVF